MDVQGMAQQEMDHVILLIGQASKQWKIYGTTDSQGLVGLMMSWASL